MGFTGSRAADEDRIAFGIEEGAGGEFANLPFIDRRIGEDELVEIFEDRELGVARAIAMTMPWWKLCSKRSNLN
jgi:hypothetical protein